MGVPTCSVNDFILVDIAGLKTLLQQILDSLKEQSQEQLDQDKRVNTLEALIVGDEVDEALGGRSRQGRRPEASLREISARIDGLEERQKTAERNRAELSSLLEQEGIAREALEERIGTLERRATNSEAKAVEADKEQVTRDAEINKMWRTFEARVTQAEAKASDSRREAKAYHTLSEEQTASISRMQQQLEALAGCRGRQSNSPDAGGKDELTRVADFFEATLQDVEKNLRSKASEAAMEAHRADVDQTYKALRASMQQLGCRFNDLEDQVRHIGRKHIPTQRPASANTPNNELLEGAISKIAGSHCLICGTDRSPSPAPVAVGSDGMVYRHVAGDGFHSPLLSADLFDAAGAATGAASAGGGGGTSTTASVVPSAPPSRPGSALPKRPPSGSTIAAATTSAATTKGPDTRGSAKFQKRPSSIPSMAADGNGVHWPASRPSSRPSSAHHRSTSRPSSATSREPPVGASANVAASRPSSAGWRRCSGAGSQAAGGASGGAIGGPDACASVPLGPGIKDGLPISSYLSKSLPTFDVSNSFGEPPVAAA